jgi:GntR family transcriptional regulator, transcriptional repressor for pyruvate dehydrogenase complex
VGRFERIANQRIYRQIVEQISRMIGEGTLQPGDRLPPERQLAEEFGVSRAAVREALSALGLMGMVEVRHGEGTFVRNVSEEGLVTPMALLLALERDEALGLEMLEIRVALEAESAYLAAQRWEPEDMTAMEEALASMQAAIGTAELAADADWQFHRAIAAAAGNSILLQVMRSLSESMQEALKNYRVRLLRIPAMDQLLLDEHRGILEAIRDRQPELAHERMRAHIERVKRTLYGDSPAAP